MTRIRRSDRSLLGQWWLSIDRGLLAAIMTLAGCGVVVALAASPAVATKKGLPAFYFAERHLIFTLCGLGLMLALSLLDARSLRRLGLALFVAGAAAMAVVLLTGEEINGARRWLRLAGISLQPSEIAKPGFAVLAAWAFAESERRPDMPGLSVAVCALGVMTALLLLQPDVGQTLLVTVVWVALLLISRRSRLAAFATGSILAAGAALAYVWFAHVRLRIDRFLAPTPGDNSQLDRAYQSFAEGGLLGRGPGEGTLKTVLPDAHTDFVLAVIAEEFGAIACLLLLALLAVITIRPILRATREADLFTRNATVALALMLAVQSLINLATNVGLIPAKGMTLPFLSVGGSSTLAVSITAGMLLALTRRRGSVPQAGRTAARMAALASSR